MITNIAHFSRICDQQWRWMFWCELWEALCKENSAFYFLPCSVSPFLRTDCKQRMKSPLHHLSTSLVFGELDRTKRFRYQHVRKCFLVLFVFFVVQISFLSERTVIGKKKKNNWWKWRSVKKWRIDNVKLRNFCTFALIYGWFAQQLTHMKIWLNVTLLSLSSLVESWWWPPSLWDANPSSQRNQLMKERK